MNRTKAARSIRRGMGGVARRELLAGMMAAAVGLPAGRLALADVNPAIALAPPAPFDFDRLIARAKSLAAAPFRPAVVAQPDVLQRIDYDAHWRIRFRKSATAGPAGPGAPVQFFHPGRYFPEPVAIHFVENGEAREVLYRPEYFDMPADSPARELNEPGFAGFRVMRPGLEPDWVSFVGASYFRTDGPFAQYGLSARGVAIDAGLSRPEEFPRFCAFWLGPPDVGEDVDLVAWALLDGPSIAGAYRFGLKRGAPGVGHRTDVQARLFMRNAVERFGVAPLTSMYWYSERDRVIADDWRPEIHDSDGLAMATGAGERIWRALDNPREPTTVSFMDDNPRGFGLTQRDHDFTHYQDDGAFYHKRPSAWIEPRGDWGKGAVQLIQLPTGEETWDNIVAYWTPETQPVAGDALAYDYAIHWVDRDPPPPGGLASVIATRQGHGGVAGQPLPEGVNKMVVDFAGPSLKGLDRESGVEPVVEARGGAILEPVAARPIVGTDAWRLSFDFDMAGDDPVDLRAYLRKDGAPLTETWLALARVRPRR